METTAELEVKAEKRNLARIGWSLFVLVAVTMGLQLIIGIILYTTPKWYSTWTLYALLLIVPQYLVAMPLAYLMLKRVPKETIPPKKLGAKQLAVVMLGCIFILFAGNLLGDFVTKLLSQFTGNPVQNSVSQLIGESSILSNLVVLAILAPVVEELFFRKLLIERLRRYGEHVAVFASALLFGLFHGNFSQFFYAYGLGLALGFVYVKTGRIQYTIAAHILINTMGSVIAPLMLLAGPEVIGMYAMLLMAVAITGLILLIRNRKKIRFTRGPVELANWQSNVFINTGMILFLLACAAMFALNTFPGMS